MTTDLSDILESAQPERLATGFAFIEGPVWHPEGRLYFVDIRKSLLFRWGRDTGVETVREGTGEGNGTTLDLQGRLVMCEGANRRVTRREADGAWVTLVDRWQGGRLNRPNDVVGRSDGSLYFTDPAARVPTEERELDVAGVYRIGPDGALSLATGDCPYPNGLAFSPDEATLYVANSRRDEGCFEEERLSQVCPHRYIWAFDVQADGALASGRVFASMASAEEGVPDGMKVDSLGRVFCTGPGGCWVFNPNGTHVGTIRLSEIPANCAFGEADRRTLFFTARTSLYALRVREPGIVAL
jgi:gluconolactonase